MLPEHKIDGDKVTVFVSDLDIRKNCSLFKTHRDYLSHVFKQLGIEITQFHTTARDGGLTRGLNFMRTDSDINPMLEVTATIGVNARRVSGSPIIAG